jgi:predicted MFS family arabinose efflux permease
VPVVRAIVWQSGLHVHPQGRREARPRGAASGVGVLLTRPMLLFFGFFLLSSMAGSGIQAWLVTVLDKLWGTPVLVASTALTAYMVGATGGTLVGGWIADKTRSNLLGVVILLTLCAMALLLLPGLVPLPDLLLTVVAVLAGLSLGTSRTPRDVMLRDASPPGQVGKVFGFVSSGLPLGSAITPVPMGFLIDMGHPELVLPVVAGLLGLSLFCAGGARETSRREQAGALAAE